MAHPEALLLSALINSGDVLAAEEKGIHPSHLHEYRNEYEWLIEYKVKYRGEPSFSAFKGQFPDFHITDHQDVSYGCELVREAHLKYLLGKTARTLTSDLRGNKTPDEILADLQSDTTKILSGYDTTTTWTNSIQDYSTSLDWALEREHSEGPTGVPFAHPSVQERMGGRQAGDVTVLAARLNQGKSWTMLTEAEHAVSQGKKVLYFSLEMSRRKMEYRFQTLQAARYGYNLTHTMLNKGKGLDLLYYKQFLQEMSSKVPGEIYFNDTSRGLVTPTTIAAAVNKLQPDEVVIDYVTLMGAANGQRASEGWQVVASITGDLKHVATSFGISILTASQINREGENKNWRPPSTANLSQGDTIGQDADNVITMKRFGKGAMVYSLEKARDSQAGLLWWSVFDPENGKFHEITRDEAEAIRTEEEFNDDDV
jgi:replicative DNA helicase